MVQPLSFIHAADIWLLLKKWSMDHFLIMVLLHAFLYFRDHISQMEKCGRQSIVCVVIIVIYVYVLYVYYDVHRRYNSTLHVVEIGVFHILVEKKKIKGN